MAELRTDRAGALRLLELRDVRKAEPVKNTFGKPLVGWRSSVFGYGGLVNPMGYAVMRCVVQKMIDGHLEDLYDQPVLIENPGAIVVCRIGSLTGSLTSRASEGSGRTSAGPGARVGLVQNWRLVGERIATTPGQYVRELEENGRWDELFRTLGAWRWELPQGLAPPSDEQDLTAFVLKSAKLEAVEEGGFVVRNARIAGRVNASPTFFPHAQYVVDAEIARVESQDAEDLEMLGGTWLATPADIRQLVIAGELDNAMSLSALAIAGVHF
ncbi:hypothetical protein A3H75_02460 [Candidatus Uhrbacteria bacterium RIFCSPLOWO2_02_FULL_51_9]|uniref:Nudix hydrolase domain-containing protein n=1 Tax=Candidatus Uhrbacteria bacterium RIFCSPLOWO2_02_FULL_51_9 TaxID=1802410 RepID=A0A1F7VFJ2_9BACT|nr:MAG: hypothetical protein A3H75_02460 [Candidatus Uhrbacteria bacterium RIFCSPLOWO2_02_FULL_51_9]